MKKFSLLITLISLAGLVALTPRTANAQDDAQAEFERAWYDTCFTKKPTDVEKCYQQSKELVEKYSKSTYLGHAKGKIKAYEQNKAWEKFQAALNAYYAPPQSVAKLEQLFAAGEEYLALQPGQQFVIGQMARAGAFSAMGELAYKNLDKVKGYAETALKTFDPAAPPEGWKKEDWEPLREIIQAQMNQFLGWQLIIPAKGDPEVALEYLAKAIQVKGKEGVGWKDPYNYYLRTQIYNTQYLEVRKPYDAMDDATKVTDAGKEAFKKVNELLDTKLIPEYARVLATATGPAGKSLYDAVKGDFDVLWKFRTDAPDKATEYIKNYADDPTNANVPVPAKPEDASNLNAPAAAPAAAAGAVKLQAGGPAIAPASGSNGSSNGAKSTADKKGVVKGKRRGRG
jgi:hypothetical protein